jgi:antitoxin HicB
MSTTHMGSSVDDFLKEEGIFEEAQALAIMEVVVWQRTGSIERFLRNGIRCLRNILNSQTE